VARRANGPHGYVFWNPSSETWCGAIYAPGRYEIYHRGTWREAYDIIDKEMRNTA